ncbi:MAG: hypothetical protein BRC33_08515 [Cyanobacteria bacterium SW_9_44_58]|nr:MAG: hypothetical protein BRC33_08515 [Cyanobacteria bacterium SW_9_44_58]
MFKHLNTRGIDVDLTTFSKASKNRDSKLFYQLFLDLRNELKKQRGIDKNQLALFPLDSTIVTLTSKLLWQQGYHQVKLFSGLNLFTSEPGGVFLHFGQGHDSKYGDKTIGETPDNGLSIIERTKRLEDRAYCLC